jgi:hypothetical protein
MINTNLARPRIYDYDVANNGVIAAYSTHSSLMSIAIEYDPYSSMFYISSPIAYSPKKDKSIIIIPDSAICEDREMTSPSIWTCSSATEISSPFLSCYVADLLPDALSVRSASTSPEPVVRTVAVPRSKYAFSDCVLPAGSDCHVLSLELRNSSRRSALSATIAAASYLVVSVRGFARNITDDSDQNCHI